MSAVTKPPPQVEVVTFGCRLNTLESQAIRQAIGMAGLAGEIIVFNTCAVTGEAVRQARQSIRRLARQRPQARLVVTGCAAQTEPDTFAAMPEVAGVLGNALKADAEAWGLLGKPETARVRVPEPGSEGALHAYGATADGRTRAFLEVQTGCDHRCTFCIIPYGRGPSRSAALGEIVDRARALVAEGVREIVLTGVDLTSWGHDLPGQPRLGSLVRGLLKHVPDLSRLRVSSLDCIEVDDVLLSALAEESRLMPHLHLSLQSGDDLILKRMKRRHTRAEAITLCTKLRSLRPELVLGADFITGFPTETPEMFAQTLDLVDACGLTHLHVFPFSARPGTPAARMPQVPRDVARQRARSLREVGARALRRHLETQMGNRLEVLTELNGQARARDFTLVRLPGTPPRKIRHVTIVGHDGAALLANPDPLYGAA